MADIRFFLRFWLETSPTSASFWRGEIQEVNRKQRHGVEDAATLLRLIRQRLKCASGIVLPLGELEESDE